MNTKRERPSILADSLVSESPKAAAAQPSKKEPAGDGLRFNVYFRRPLHDKLREIAFAERKSIAELIHEGLDEVLRRRSYPSTEELK